MNQTENSRRRRRRRFAYCGDLWAVTRETDGSLVFKGLSRWAEAFSILPIDIYSGNEGEYLIQLQHPMDKQSAVVRT